MRLAEPRRVQRRFEERRADSVVRDVHDVSVRIGRVANSGKGSMEKQGIERGRERDAPVGSVLAHRGAEEGGSDTHDTDT